LIFAASSLRLNRSFYRIFIALNHNKYNINKKLINTNSFLVAMINSGGKAVTQLNIGNGLAAQPVGIPMDNLSDNQKAYESLSANFSMGYEIKLA